MDTFKVGDTVQITREVLRGQIGTVVWWYEDEQKWLVRVGGSAQDYFRPDEIEHFRP